MKDKTKILLITIGLKLLKWFGPSFPCVVWYLYFRHREFFKWWIENEHFL